MSKEQDGQGPWMSESVQGAIALHEMYRSYLAGGFTRTQALHITVAILLENIRYQRDHGS